MKMIDVTGKEMTRREAVAAGRVTMQPETLKLIKEGKLPKGDVLAAARVAGILAAKQTPHLIPLCHPLLIGYVGIDFELNPQIPSVTITATVRGEGKTGFEMEALTAVAVSALTIYDMCKMVDSELRLEDIYLVKKTGGKSDKARQAS